MTTTTTPRAARLQLTSWHGITSLIARLVVAAILLQTLYFKFTGAPESVYIFTKLHLEPAGRFGSGAIELLASVLLLYPGTVFTGALLAFGVICGALYFHLTVLGISVLGDHGQLFSLAVTVFLLSGYLLVLHRREHPRIGPRRPH